MAYAIVQKELVVPDLERLKRAFAVSPLLTDLDAQTSANDAYGILLRGLELQQGLALKQALLREEIETELVEETKLPVIPPPKVARQVEFQDSHITFYDSMQRASQVLWSDIMLIAAGYVRTRETRKHRAAAQEAQARAAATSSTPKPRDDHYAMSLDIFLPGGSSRYSISADEFRFDSLGSRQTDDLAMNFVFLVQDFAQQTPHAGLNRGAFLACQRPPELFPYPSKAAFNEEITWMLWRVSQLVTAGAKAVGS